MNSVPPPVPVPSGRTRRLAAGTLFAATPLIAEYLLGSLSLSQIAAWPILCLLYGSGAVLVREAARTAGRGWRRALFLAAGYATLEEGIGTQSLFNPHYLHLHLLDYGYLPALGMGAWWTVFVISLHVIWSLAVPIGLAEAAFPAVAEVPWLGTGGRAALVILLALGTAAMARFTWQAEHFTASAPQLAGGAGVAIALVGLGLRPARPRPAPSGPGAAPRPWRVAVFAFACGSGIELAGDLEKFGLPWELPTAGVLAIDAAVVAVLLRWSARPGWRPVHRFALAAGGLLVYCWCGFRVEVSLHGPRDLGFHTVLVAAALGLLAGLGWRFRTVAARGP